MTLENVRDAVRSLEERSAQARIQGALFHTTNPVDSWFCSPCSVFGKGGEECWSCGSPPTDWQYIPRWGGGCQRTSEDNV